MKTPAFIPLVLFVLLAGYAIAAEPRHTKAQKARIDKVVAETHCLKCLTNHLRFDSVSPRTNVMKEVGGKLEPVGHWECYWLKCRKCGEKQRVWKEIVPPPPVPTRAPSDPR